MPSSSERRKERYQENIAHITTVRRAHSKAIRETHSGRAAKLFNGAAYRAKKSDIPFTLSKGWIEDRLKSGCAQTGLPFDLTIHGVFKGPGKAMSPSLDRINPDLGYTPDNTQVVCWAYNGAKGRNTDRDVLLMARALVSKYGMN